MVLEVGMLRCYPARLTNSHWIASVLHASLDLGEHRGNRGFWDINVDFCICFVGKSRKSYSPRSNVHQEEATENMKIFPKFRTTTIFAQSTSVLLFGIPQYVELVIVKTRGSMDLESASGVWGLETSPVLYIGVW